MNKKILAGSFFIFLCSLIVAMNTSTSIPLLQNIRTFPFADKMAHIGMYGLLALLVNMAIGFSYIRISSAWKINQFAQLGSLAVLFFSLAEEWSQQFFPSRTMDVWDAACNVIGVGLFTVLSVHLYRQQSSNRQQSLRTPVRQTAQLGSKPSVKGTI